MRQYIEPPSEAALAAIDRRTRDFTQEKPVNDQVFEVMRRMYAYDQRPLNETVEAVEDEGQWRKESLLYDAGYANERMRVFLDLPENAAPPFQTVIYFPPGGPRGQSSRKLGLRMWIS